MEQHDVFGSGIHPVESCRSTGKTPPPPRFAVSFVLLITCAANLLPQTVYGQPNAEQSQQKRPVGFFNLDLPTIGGKQFWTDVRYVDGYRVQENSETGHFRLIDSDDIRRAWGNRAHCNQQLDQLIQVGKVRPHSGKVVVLLHGLMRTSDSMEPMAKYLAKQGYSTVNFRYASTRKTVAEHAAALHEVIEGLGNQVTEIYFVAHSLGNIVIRRYLHDYESKDGQVQGDSRIKAIVMLGPPNQGSRMARLLKSSLLFNTLTGVSGAQLSVGWDRLEPNLATPTVPFGIIAGGQENENFSNLILSGKDDFTVSVAETKLAGAADFVVWPLFHSTMMHQPEVLRATHHFFQHGNFVSEAQRQPLLRDSGGPTSGRNE